MRRLAIAVLGFAAIVACDSNKVTVDLSADAGNYVLRSLNDTVLPYTYTKDSVLTILITADTIFMGVDGHFLDRTHYLRTQSGVTDFPIDSTAGSWTEEGATVIFSDDLSGYTFTADFSGTSLIMVGGGLKATYTR
jgi:hypothetical protein